LNARAIWIAPSGRVRAGWRLLAFLALFGAAWFVFLAIAGFLQPAMALHPNAPRNQIITVLATVAALLFAHAVMLRFVDHLPWSWVGLGLEAAQPRRWAPALLLGALAIALPSLLLWNAHWLLAEPSVTSVSTGRFLLQVTALLLPAALLEELLMRGYPFAVLKDSLGSLGALIVTSVIFAALHWRNPGVSARALLSVALAGVFLGTVLLVTGSLYAAWATHFAWNWVMAALLHTSVSGLPFGAPGWRLVDAGPDWATGGSWGPEGGAGAFVGMLLSIGWLLRRPEARQWIASRARSVSSTTEPHG
jgi:membrane protease YdiL (CAAX protease family)